MHFNTNFISLFHFRLEKDCEPLPETLNLLLEEAVFLNYGLGCLYVFDIHGQKSLSCSDFWLLCVECDSRFVQRYVTYHHFRSKGWIVKSGLKFGGDFCKYISNFLYSFYHKIGILCFHNFGTLSFWYSIVQRWSRFLPCVVCCSD